MKAIILDMYGVIVKQTGDDFVPYIQQTFPNLELEEIRKPWDNANMGEVSSLEMWAAIGFQGDLEKIEKDYLDTIELNDGFLEFIKAAGMKYKLAIISNDSSRWSKYLREKFNINQYFDVISISGDLKIRKPDERIFRLTIEKLAVNAEECLYVDDRRGYLGAAGKVGMNTILFNSRNVPYEGDVVNNFKELEDRLQRITPEELNF
ncbi:MAG: HAD-IA family hydrolase [Lachnospiraceae bacterium]|nr:HAD-IA family hydrolase [Lachnospiraceae bacterium]